MSQHIHGSPKAGAGRSEKPWFLESEGFQGQEQREIQGRFKNKFRKPLAQRILELTCRICNQPGHWKAECPMRQKGTKSNPPAGSTAFARVAMAQDVLTASAQPCDQAHDDEPPEHATPLAVEETCLMIHVQPSGLIGNNWVINRDHGNAC